MTAFPSFAASQKIGPANTMLTGCAWNRKLVTTPKLPPPPRSAQNRSGCCACARRDEAAVGQHDVGLEEVVDGEPELARQVPGAAAERESRPRRCCRRCRTARPGRRRASRGRRPRSCSQARPARSVPGSTRTLFIIDRSITRPSLQLPSPGPLWPPPRMASSRPCSRAKFTAVMTSAASTARAIRRGRLSIMPL